MPAIIRSSACLLLSAAAIALMGLDYIRDEKAPGLQIRLGDATEPKDFLMQEHIVKHDDYGERHIFFFYHYNEDSTEEIQLGIANIRLDFERHGLYHTNNHQLQKVPTTKSWITAMSYPDREQVDYFSICTHDDVLDNNYIQLTEIDEADGILRGKINATFVRYAPEHPALATLPDTIKLNDVPFKACIIRR